MRPRQVRRWGVGMVLGAALTVGGVTQCSSPAHATPTQDAAFLFVLDSVGIQYASATKVITAGYAVCALRDQGMAELAVAETVYQQTGLDAFNAGFFVGAAEAAYCPEHLSTPQVSVRA